jgi:hypothetical protein
VGQSLLKGVSVVVAKSLFMESLRSEPTLPHKACNYLFSAVKEGNVKISGRGIA